jgi:hypothetical protein
MERQADSQQVLKDNEFYIHEIAPGHTQLVHVSGDPWLFTMWAVHFTPHTINARTLPGR